MHPDPIKTDMGDHVMGQIRNNSEEGWDAFKNVSPMGQVGQPEDIANCILFLASDEARHVTGSELIVDGGMLAE